MSVIQLFPEFIREDLAKSGLEIADMNVRPLGSAERHATGSPQSPEGYVIPYMDIRGKALPFYRAKLKGWDPKYKQLTDEPNHIYFPKGFWDEASDADYILFVEGEKKAACALKHGFAAAACGGVDSWSNKTVSLPKDAKLTKGRDGRIIAKLTAGNEDSVGQDGLAVGMKELIELVIRRDIPLVIVYDSEEQGKVAPPVQAAAARLGYALRFHGIPAKNIRQFIIKPPPGYFEEKIGLDDLLVGTKITAGQLDIAIRNILSKPSAFPRHPNPREYINKKLRQARMTREQLQNLATSILCDLDSNGTRLYSQDEDELYYFSRTTRRLMKVNFKLNEDYAKSDWGVYLYQQYNLSAGDERVLVWLEALFAGEEPIAKVEPERVLAVRDQAIYYQISSSQMIRVMADDHIRVLDNGSDDILFLSNAVEDLDKGKLVAEINRLVLEERLPNYWLDVLKRARLADPDGKQARLLSYLYSVSPWFYRWKGTQLPIEMMVGEPGSGKSTLYELRLSIINGRPRLRNPPSDIRDWGVSVGNTGAMHVTDNVNMVNSQLRQTLSDEMCRLVTEPHPTIEKRKLYTDNTIVDIPVKTVFAVTSVKQPFSAPDIIQRSIITYMDKGEEAVEYQGDWALAQLELFGGREGWMAQQLVFIRRLLQLVPKEWNTRYKAKFRLINVEQLLRLAAKLYGDEDSDAWVVEYIEVTQAEKIADNDLVIGALKKFAQTVVETYGPNDKSKKFTARRIAEWAEEEEEFKGLDFITNPRKLGKFMKQNTNLLATVCGITEHGTETNATAYYAHHPKR
jgi:hypothetical protein